ncbi:MAG: sulfate ABC transporter permease subunit CysT [Thermoguttaceae bacterium]|nr:sulfate ABC transporter permease subunit CysT [Thermoguttaceae bacterium]
MRLVQRSALPGFNITMGFTVAYLSLIVLIPLSGLFIVTSDVSFAEFYKTLTSELVKRAFVVTFRDSFIAAVINAFFGLIVAWTLARYQFWGRRILDAMVDVPFALPTAVSGLALAQIYSDAKVGWIGPYLPFKVFGTEIGVTIALIFIGTPFVIRTLQPALKEVERELEEVSASLGATRWQTFWRVIFPAILPALIAGFTMAFARALGEYGSVLFIGRMIEGKTELVSGVIMRKLNEENGVVAASTVALAMLLVSFALLLLINGAQAWAQRRSGKQD